MLFLASHRGPPAWMGWGHILESSDRWRVYGTSTICTGVLKPPLPAVDPSVHARDVFGPENPWENRALGALLGLVRYRNRTPYGDMGARDLRLTNADLHKLARLQPRLRCLRDPLPRRHRVSFVGEEGESRST